MAYEESERLVALAKCEGKVLRLLDDIVGNIEGISKRHSELLQHSGELSAAAERLQAEEAVLTQHANEIGRPLLHYDAVDRISTQLLGIHFQPRPRHYHNHDSSKKNQRRSRPFQVIHHGMSKLQVDQTEEVAATLEQLDASIAYFQQTYWTTGNFDHYDYKERAIVLREATLDIIRSAVADRISQTTSDIQAALFPKKSKTSNSSSLSADKLEASLIYTRFHGISSRSKSLLQILNQQMTLQQRSQAQDNSAINNNEEETNAYKELWEYCRNIYCTSRNSLLQGTLQSHLDKLRQQHGLVGMTRLASVFLIRICTLETSLYLDFFGTTSNTSNKKNGKINTPKSTTPTSGNNGTKLMAAQLMTVDGKYIDTEFQSYLDGLCGNLYKTVRRGLVTLLDLDTLCQVVSVLREERTLANASPTTMAAARAISNCTLDAQERLIFCANSQLNKEVLKFKPTPADLNYPDKLRSPTNDIDVNDSGTDTANNNTNNGNALDAMYASWFPPMRSVLKVLSKIFRVVEPRVFEDIALISVQACTATLKDSALYIAHKSGTMHGDLFLVKHLLILREQLSPFDIQLTSVQRQLDFSDAGKAVGRFLANRNRRLFSMSNENALVTLLREGLSIQESSVDSKRDLEDALRSACNDFLEHSSTSLAGPIFVLLDELKKKKQTQPSSSRIDAPEENNNENDKDGIDSTNREELLKHVHRVISKTLDRLEPEMGEITTQMTLYMDNSATTQILLRPIVRKVTRVLTEVKRQIQSSDDNESNRELLNESLKLLEEMELKIKQSATATFINNNQGKPARS